MVPPTRPDDLAATSGEPAANATRFGRYVVLSRLGEGAMGVVYSGYDELLERRVAVKLVRRRLSGDTAGRARLLREAQALAQLSHPNVVQVYDAGEWNQQIFIALEFVHGRTLTAWLKEQARTWPEIIAVFLEAGRGLAAAHAAGIVHRDVKPDNFMIDDHGRVRVMDFGLALPVGLGEEGEADAGAARQTERSVLRMTADGALIGTPAYMAPEQFLREPADARTDQFGFCTALFEALFGARPHPGQTIDEISRAVLLGERIDPPARSPVPPRIQRAVLRGLALDPADRFPDMPALLAELAPPPARSRRRALAAAIAGVVVAAVVVVRSQAAATCANGAEHLVGVWDEARADAVERALLGTDLEFAADTFARVRRSLDDYAAGWVDMHNRTCAAHRDGERSSVALDLQMHCLQRRRAELDALVDVLSESDADTATRAAHAVTELRPVATCDDWSVLLDEQRRLGLPADPVTATWVQQLRRSLAQIEAEFLSGKFTRALAHTDEVIGAAQAIDYPPILAEALFWRGRILTDLGDMTEAASTLWGAYLTAVQAGHEAIELRALVTDVYVQGYGLQAFAAADRSAAVARALLSRRPDREQEGELLHNLSSARTASGRLRDGEALLRASLARRELDSVELGATLHNLADVLRQQARLEEAAVVANESLSVMRRILGEHHPYVHVVQGTLALNYLEAGRLDEAESLLQTALPALIASHGSDRPDYAELFAARGILNIAAGQIVGGLQELNHAVALAERSGLADLRMQTRFALARALWDHATADRPRALALARDAVQDAITAGDPVRQRRIVAWLASRE